MLHKSIIPYPDGRYTTNGIAEVQGQLLDRIPRGAGMAYRFDLSEVFDDCLDYASVERGGGVLGELDDQKVTLFSDGHVHRGEGDERFELLFYSASGEMLHTVLVIEEAQPGREPVTTPKVDADGFLIAPDGRKVTNKFGWWMRFARKVRRVETLKEISYPVLAANGQVLSTGPGEMMVWRRTEFIRGGDTLKPQICRDKDELTAYYLSHGMGPIMASETEQFVWGKEPEEVV